MFDDLIIDYDKRADEKYENRKQLFKEFVERWSDDPQILSGKLIEIVEICLEDMRDYDQGLIDLGKELKRITGDDRWLDDINERYEP